MRDEAIALLAASSSIMFSIASVAGEKPDLHQRLENASPESGALMRALYVPALRSKYPESFESTQKVTVTPDVRPERTSLAAARDNPAQWSDPVTDLELSRTMGSPRMITWTDCSAPSNGSALSIYFSREKAAQFWKGSAIRDNVLGHQCSDADEEGADEN
jgi:hypothetical protein